MSVKFTVGELAKLHHMPKQNLIFYDKIGLFKPKIVDPNNNYRYYTQDQLEVLDSILILRDVGIPLKDIQTFLEQRDPDITIRLMQEQKAHIAKQISELKQIHKRLETKIETIETLKEVGQKVTFKHLKEQYILVHPVQAPHTLLETDVAIKALFKKASDEAYTYQYQLGVINSTNYLEEGGYIHAEYVFLPLEKQQKKASIGKKPTGLYACIYHKGNYEDIGIAYEKLRETIKKEGYTLEGYAYEYCVADSLTCKSPEDYVTEIQIRVVPGNF